MDRSPRGRNLRKGRVSEVNRIYLVTAVTRKRLPIFGDLPSARHLIRSLMKEQELGRASTLAFVVMPDHFHWLLQLREDASLSKVVRAVKAVTAHRLGAPVWHDGFHDRALRQEEDLTAAARYVVANPLRAGLVQNLGDYPHWDAIWL